MEYAQLGRTGISVSRVCLGTWQAYGWERSDDEEFLKILHSALNLGVNFFDTAPAYGKGHSERLLGSGLSGYRDKIVIATKLPHQASSEKQIRQSLEESLRNLRTDYIDLYQQHWPSTKLSNIEILSILEALKKEGKIRAIGVCNWLEQDWCEIEDLDRIDVFQPCYNLLWRHIERAILPLCTSHTIGVIPYSPLCQGILAGRIQSLDTLPRDPRRQNIFTRPDIFPRVLEFLNHLKCVADRHNRTLANIALEWLFAQNGVTSLIIGCTHRDQLQDSVGSLVPTLSSDEIDELTNDSNAFISATHSFLSLWDWHPKYTIPLRKVL
ncbi:MAG: aldo/keto reductase [Bdellovibrionales bacterium]|nr:aldo/keto reductase [Bdellovibrionales bacterium]